MLVDFALEFDYLRWMLLGRRESSRGWERGVLEGTQIDRLVGSCKLAGDMLLMKVEEAERERE